MAKAAVSKFEALEEEYHDCRHMDMVLVGSDSIDTVKTTHANYFDGSAKDVLAEVLRIANSQPIWPGTALAGTHGGRPAQTC